MPGIIDADTHVDESEDTWSSLTGALQKYAPQAITVDAWAAAGGTTPFGSRWWIVEGHLHPRATRDEEHHPSLAKRQLDDVPGRIEDMDRMNVDKQVIFPTFFIRYGSDDPVAEAAITHAYNEWIADRCAQSGGRLQWTVVLPYLDPDKTVAELRWAKEHGACGIFKRGYEMEKQTSDPHFDPLYEEADALGLPLCVHTGHPLPGREWDRGFPVMGAFTSIVTSGLASRFKNLRFGFIEAGASWIPYSLTGIEMQQRSLRLRERATNFELARDLFKEDRLYVTIDPIDDIERLLDYGTEDNFIVGTDYCHSDPSANLAALGEVQAWADEGKISSSVATKILTTNANAFYGF